MNINAKIVLLGESSVGKTSIIMRGVRNDFEEFGEPTIGAAFNTMSQVIDNTTVNLEIWDTAGQERYRSLAPMYYRGANLAMIVYDITNLTSIDSAESWINEINNRITDHDCRVVLVGNKYDIGISTTKVTDKIDSLIQKYSYLHNPIHHIKVSAKSGLNITNLFGHIFETIKEDGHVNTSNGRDTESTPFIIKNNANVNQYSIWNMMPC